MKRFWLGFALGIVFMIVVSAAWFLVVPRLAEPSGVRNGRPVPPHPQSASGGALRVALGGEHGDDVVFSRGTEEFRFTPPAGEFCEFPTCTPDGKTGFVLVHTEEAQGYSYDCILRFDFGSSPLASIRPRRILARPDLEALFGGRDSWVNDLHKVSADGNRLLLNISTERTPSATPGTTCYFDYPYWYDISGNKLNEPSD